MRGVLKLLLRAVGIGLLLLAGLALFSYVNNRMPLDYPVSDHFNGLRFTNPTLIEQISPGISDIVGMIREGRPEWPTRIENTGLSQLDADLGQDGIAVTFVNHATFLIQMPGVTILTDPVWSERTSPVSWFGPRRVRDPGLSLDALPNVDVVLVSHNHYDHLDLATLEQLNARFSPLFLVPLGNRALLQSAGISNVKEMDWWDAHDVPSETRVTFTPAQHSSGRGLFDRDRTLWGSFYIKRDNRSLFFGGDGGYSGQFTEIRERLGAPDIALLGIGSYVPRWFMKPLHKNPAEAVQAHLDLGATLSIGMHMGTFQLAGETFDQPFAELADALASERIDADRFMILKEGETWLVEPHVR